MASDMKSLMCRNRSLPLGPGRGRQEGGAGGQDKSQTWITITDGEGKLGQPNNALITFMCRGQAKVIAYRV